MGRSVRGVLLSVAVVVASTVAPQVALADDGAAGFGLAFGVAAGYAVAGLPYFLGRDSGPGGPAGDAAFGLGVGRRANAFALGSEMGGAFANDGRLTYVARARIDMDQGRRSTASVGARIDGVLGIALFGRRARTMVGELVLGGAVWPSYRDEGTTSRAYGAVGPLVGARFRVATARPLFYSETEIDYVALFGLAPTGRHHHVDLVTTAGFTPWPTAFGAPAFEVRLKRELGLGPASAILGDDTSARSTYGGTAILLGMRFAILNRGD